MIKKIITLIIILLALLWIMDIFNFEFIFLIILYFLVITFFYVINRQELREYFKYRDKAVYLLNLGLLFIALVVYPLAIGTDNLFYVLIYSAIGLLLFLYNLRDCINRKKTGIIWWPRFLMALLVSTPIMIFQLSFLSRGVIAIAVVIFSIPIYFITVIYGIIKLLKTHRESN